MSRSLLVLTFSTVLFAANLHPGRTIGGEISGDQSRTCTVLLKSGQYARLLIWQPRFPSVLRLHDPESNKPLVELRLPGSEQEPEPLVWIAERTGEYGVELTAEGQAADRGRYRIKLDLLRTAVPEDRKRIAAQEAYGSARESESKKDYAKAIESWKKALVLYHDAGDREREAVVLRAIGSVNSTMGRYDQAIGYYEQALSILHEIRDRRGEGEALNGLGDAQFRIGENEKAIAYHRQALQIFITIKDRRNQAESLNGLGNASRGRNTEEALHCYERALALWRVTQDRLGQGRALANIGTVYFGTGRYENALKNYDESRESFVELKNRRMEAIALLNAGKTLNQMGKADEAIGRFGEALVISREIKNRYLEGQVLQTIGYSLWGQSKVEKALTYEEQALAIAREVRSRSNEGMALMDMGLAYVSLARFEKAIDCLTQALSILETVSDREKEIALINLGYAYDSLGQFEQAINLYEQALPISRTLGDRDGEGRDLVDLGSSYGSLGQFQKAIGFHEQALEIFRDLKDRHFEAITLKELAIVYQDLKQYERSLKLDEEALAIRREINDSGESESLSNLGNDYRSLHQIETSIRYHGEALAMARQLQDRMAESNALNGLMEAWNDTGNLRLAVFYGKQAVNTLQSVRTDIRGLARDLQRGFLRQHETPYHTLAGALISLGRLTEAEQVLSLLKEEEYFQYIRRDANEPSLLNARAELTPDEADWEKRYREIGDQLMAIGAERGQLLAKKTRTPQETQRLTQLGRDIAVGNQKFQQFLGDLAQHFSAKTDADRRIEDLRETQGIMEDLRELPEGTIAIYTLVGQDKFYAILRTADAQKAFEYPIKAADLNQKVLDFRQAVQDPRIDPRPLAQELYKILVGVMAEDLQQARAQTLMWSLDGVLRYVPLAALYDGKRYLIEQYRLSVMTLASSIRLKDRPDSQWTAAGFGVTKAYEDTSALPSVSAELAGIISTAPGDAGVMHGEIKLNADFTQQSMREALLKRYPVVHIASHFRFQPGNETQSFLLLGDGAHLSLAELKTSANLFGGVQLLTLSACNTGVGDGAEVEGFGTLAQRQGAKAVIASLWPVMDESTSRLMRELYRIRESSPGITKLEALRQAQLELLHGHMKTGDDAATRGVIPNAEQNISSSAVDSEHPYSHPYYWAPFFLMGNWL